MRKLILASRSKARRALLRRLGIRFCAVTPSILERKRLTGACGAFVIQNALRKARAVARRFSDGVVVAADTVVLAGRRIIGKPKHRGDAMKMLSVLSRKPQWVYTGLAIIDCASGRTVTGYEKTKVYMCRLTKQQISRYIDYFKPYDKAGSFDIEGMGGIFIDRIEGCYYNVIGLPLAKLAKMLQSVGIDIFDRKR